MRAVAQLLVPTIALLLACDPRAKGGEDSSARPSTEYETCSRTSDCDGELRCRDGICRDPRTVPVGEYYAAVGELAFQNQKYERAIAAFTEASKAFELAKVPIPAEIDCGHGSALTRAGGDPQRFELAARVLHRCLMQAPAGSGLRRNALASLAELGREGLDPKLLQLDKLADRYMTGKPAMPPVANLVLEVAGTPAVKSYTYTRWLEKLGSDDVKAALIPCWQEHFKATRDSTMVVTLPMKHSFRLDQYGDFGRTTLEVGDLKPVGDAGRDGAAECAKAAINPIADEHTKGREDERRWDATFTLTLKPKG